MAEDGDAGCFETAGHGVVETAGVDDGDPGPRGGGEAREPPLPVSGVEPWTHKDLLTREKAAVGFYVSWDENSRESLADHVGQLDVVSPQWIALKGAAGEVDVTLDAQARAIIARAKTPPSIMPGVHNAKDGVWNGPAADAVVLNPAARARLVKNLADQAKARGYAGYVFDLETCRPRRPAWRRAATSAASPGRGRAIATSAGCRRSRRGRGTSG